MHPCICWMEKSLIISISCCIILKKKYCRPKSVTSTWSLFMGKSRSGKDVVNAARRFPMFAERMVVILKEASQMKDLNELAGYIENPSPTTILVLEHRFKKVDGRSKLVKLIPKKGIYFTSEKLKEDEVPQLGCFFRKGTRYGNRTTGSGNVVGIPGQRFAEDRQRVGKDQHQRNRLKATDSTAYWEICGG